MREKRTRETLSLSQITYGKLIETELCREKRADICDFFEHEDETNKETYEELQQRIHMFITFVKSQVSPFNTVLVVSHGDFIHALSMKSQPYPNNAEMQIIDI